MQTYKVTASEWWDSLSKEEQQDYIKEHPDSKFAKNVKTDSEKPLEKKEKSPEKPVDKEANKRLKQAYAKRDKIQREIDLVTKKLDRYKKSYELSNNEDDSSMISGLENRLRMLEKDLSNVERFHVKPAELDAGSKGD